jgi:hypothetical protein
VVSASLMVVQIEYAKLTTITGAYCPALSFLFDP